MDIKDLKNQIKKGESDTIEFKENFNEEAIQTLGAFANTNGGNVLIGVDKSGKIKGTTIGSESLPTWSNQISQISEPTIIPNIYSVEIDLSKEDPVDDGPGFVASSNNISIELTKEETEIFINQVERNKRI